MKASVYCFVVTIVLAAMSAAQTAPAALQLNTIYSGADGKFEAAPDTAVLTLNIGAQQDTAKAAEARAAAAADRVRQALRNNGVDPKLAQFSMYQLQPVIDWKDPKHRVLAYRATSSLILKLRDLNKAGELLEPLSSIEDTQNQSVSYTLEDIEQAKSKASEDALNKARNQAKAVATAGGRTLGELLNASVDVNQTNIVPVFAPQRMAMAGANATPPPTAEFTPQSITITAHVNALFALK
ncbi:MAG TPA: SIMPL domain-containing protein [Candidatus Angelobacter sp.]|jgi:hypothetical protein